MSTFFHKFEVRWSDLDANRHMANSSYMMYCAQARMAFMYANGLRMATLVHWGLGPVILHEEFSFYKEITADQFVYVSVELTGMSEDGSIFAFTHKFYTPEGTHRATSRVVGVWIDSMLRKITIPSEDILDAFAKYKTDQMEILTMEDIKNLSSKPQNIDRSAFQKPNL